MLTTVDKFQMLIGSAQPTKVILFFREVKEMKINEKIYSLRKEHHLSQEELADKIGVSRQTVSKWELGESCPDFDKIIPLCEVFGITSDELLKDKKVEKEEKKDNQKPDVVKAALICISIFIYFIAIVSIVLSEEFLHLNEGLSVAIFLTLCGVATATIIFACMTRPRSYRKDEVEEKKKNPLLAGIISVLSLITTCVYLLISFLTMAWHITWIIWIIYSIIVRIIQLSFALKEENNEK